MQYKAYFLHYHAMNKQLFPDLDEITRNLISLDLAHITPEVCAAYKHEPSAMAKPSKGIAFL
jgi:hypothetical protein